jgi:putative tryptophan/tyrosine transport system substrate-binding protein
VKRREFITLLGGAAAWPLAASARRLGMLTGIADDAAMHARYAAFRQVLSQLGWTEGRNLQIEYRWGGGSADSIRKNAAELAALAPDVILATGGASADVLLQMTRTVPIVFVLVPDPVGAGFVDSLSRPGGNATGFMQFEYSLSGKWLELLKEIAPHVKRAAVLRDSTLTSGVGQFAVIQSVAPALGMEVIPINLRERAEIERAITVFVNSGGGGLVVTSSPAAVVHREMIAALAARHKLPAVYPARDFVTSGALLSYSANFVDQYRPAARYVDRILTGEKPADLPVQAPTKYELVINLKAAKATGVEIPPSLLARADEVIE